MVLIFVDLWEEVCYNIHNIMQKKESEMKLTKILTTLAVVLVMVFSFTTTALAYTFEDDRFIINLEIPEGYIAYDQNSVLSENDEYSAKVQNRIDNGMVIDALNPQTKSELTVYTSTDSLSTSIKNYTKLDEKSKQEFAQKYKQGLSINDHTFLVEPTTVTINNYDYLRILARVGSSTSGYSYLSLVTIINGNYYEATAYLPQTIPTEDEIAQAEQLLSTFKVDVYGLEGQINRNTVTQIITTTLIIVCSLLMIFIAIRVANTLFLTKEKEAEQNED